jgi:putative ABC transport system permease protein
MRGLLPYAWRSLAARPGRSLLTVFGIAIGVGVLVAALAIDAGLDASIDRTVAGLVGRADLRVAAFTEAGLSGTTLSAIDRVSGVALTAPAIERRSYLEPAAGRPASTEPVTVLGIAPASESRVRDLSLARGAPLESLSEPVALITERLAASDGLDVGSQLTILGAGAPVTARVVGVLPGDGPIPGSSGRTVVLPLLTAARLNVPYAPDPGSTGSPDDGSGSVGGGQATDTQVAATPAADTLSTVTGLTRIDVVLAAGADPEAVTRTLEQALTREPYVLSTPDTVATSLRASTADVRATMAMLAAIALFAAAFLILNTLAMTVVERIRELGLLRAAGAGRSQLVRLVISQGLLLGAAGAAGGLLLGAALGQVVARLLRTAGSVDLDGPVITPGVVAAGLLAGLGITLVAALEPARRAAGVSPVTALRARADPAATVRARTGWLVVVIGVVGLLAALLLPIGSATDGGLARAAAVYAVLLFAVLVSPVLLAPLARLAGLPFGWLLRLEERLARAAIVRDRARAAATIGALVVGLAMVVALGAVATNARIAATSWLVQVVPGDEILTAIAPVPLEPDGVEREIAATDGVERVTPIASFALAFDGTRLDATAIRGADIEADGRLVFVAGDRRTALAAIDQGGAAILSRSRAGQLGVGVGDVLAVTTADGLVELDVVGIVDRSFPGQGGDSVLVGWLDAVDLFGVQGADAFAVRYRAGAEPAASGAVDDLAREIALTPAPITRVEGALGDALDRLFGLLDLLALAAVVVAALGIVNTLSMDTLERVRELGMLRAVGMSRRQVWRSVLVEAGILGAIGGLVGSAAGVGIGWLLVSAGGTTDVVLPWPTIGLTLVLGVALAMLAAAQPARIAGRRSIVAAVRAE